MAPVSRRQAVLDAMPGTVPQIMEKAKVARRTAWRWIKELRADGESHIVGWKRQPCAGVHLAIHGAGPGKDAVCNLKPISNKTRWRRYKASRSTEMHDLKKAKDRARHSLRRAIKTGDPLVNALFGRSA